MHKQRQGSQPLGEASEASGGSAQELWRQNLRGDTTLKGPRPQTWWTGCHPTQCAGWDEETKVLRVCALLSTDTYTRKDVLDYFDNVWTLEEVLFSSLQGEEPFYRAPYHNLRHPLIFYYGHPPAVYINKLRVAGLVDDPVNSYLETILETGVDEMTWDDIDKNEMLWPSVQEVTEYRRTVYRLIRGILENHPGLNGTPITPHLPLWSLFMGMEHQRIHVETSSVLIRELPVHLLCRPSYFPPHHPATAAQKPPPHPVNKMIPVAGGHAVLGKPNDFPSYGWDCEYGRLEIDVPAFRASQFLVSNGEFLEFVRAGGYSTRRFWSESGWKWRAFRNAKAPVFWVLDGPAGLHRYNLRLTFDIVPLCPSLPAVVNFYEAKAFCAWRTEKDRNENAPYRVVTEAESYLLRDPRTREWPRPYDPTMHLGGKKMAEQGINMNLAFASESPVDAGPANSMGFHDIHGNVWEYAEDHAAALPGFKVHPYYDDFSTPCMDGKHRMILGGSYISGGDVASIFARYHFRDHFFQHLGFRLVRSEEANVEPITSCMDGPGPYVAVQACCTRTTPALTAAATRDYYETEKLLGEYLSLHFNDDASSVLPYDFGPVDALSFPRRCADLVKQIAHELQVPLNRALDVGCAVGRSTFELARTFQKVVGLDVSTSFVRAAETLRVEGSLPYFMTVEGDLHQSLVARVDPSIDCSRVTFVVGDACRLSECIDGEFDAVLAANLLCRLPSPRLFLKQLTGEHGLLRRGGIVAFMSPFTWMEKFTPKSEWIGGFVREKGEEVYSRANLGEVLGDELEMVKEFDMPLLIREHARKFQYIVTHCSVWRRKDCTV